MGLNVLFNNSCHGWISFKTYYSSSVLSFTFEFSYKSKASPMIQCAAFFSFMSLNNFELWL